MDRILNALTLHRVPVHELSVRGRVVISQLPFTLTMLVLFLGIIVFHPHDMTDRLFQAAVALTVGLSVLCAVVPWHRLPATGTLVVPVLDFVPIVLLREGVGDTLTGVGMLAAFPVIWLAASGQAPGWWSPWGVC